MRHPHVFPFVTLALISANLLGFWLEMAAGGYPACEEFGLVPAKLVASGEVTPVFSSLFLHVPGSWAHLGGNMAFLAFFGAVAEGAGRLRFLALYLAAGVAGALLHVGVDPSSTIPLVGASAAVFGVMALAAVQHPRLLACVVGCASIEVWRAVTGDLDVSAPAHIGGFAVGVIGAAVTKGSASCTP